MRFSYFIFKVLLIILFCNVSTYSQDGNNFNDSFPKAKQTLEKIYSENRQTIYCNFKFDEDKNVKTPDNFTTKYKNRANKIEWEHVVPAEHFGREFIEWKEGHPDCIDSKANKFKGRKCAEKVNKEYRLMQADMYNLFPEVGSVNALRQNYDFAILDKSVSSFNGCEFKVKGEKAEPPERARGVIARTYLYFEATYPKYKMSEETMELMQDWDKNYPISNKDDWECKRYKKIKEIQGNDNKILSSRCFSSLHE